MTNIREIHDLLLDLDALGVPRHPDVDKAIESNNLIQCEIRQERTLPGRLLELDADALRDRFTEIASRADERWADVAVTKMQSALTTEAFTAMVDYAPTIIKKLRPTFGKAAKVVNEAAQTGIRPGMAAQEVIDIGDQAAVEAWRTLAEPTDTLHRIAAIRVRLSEMFGICPAVTQAQHNIGERVDWSSCFTHPDSGVTVGFGTVNSQHRWLSLAIATGGRLRLNDPEETAVILHGQGESAGWIVCAAGALVHDGERRDLQLYQADWVPTWVDADQIDHLIDGGFVVAARPDAKRPADQYPHGSEGNPIPRRTSLFR